VYGRHHRNRGGSGIVGMILWHIMFISRVNGSITISWAGFSGGKREGEVEFGAVCESTCCFEEFALEDIDLFHRLCECEVVVLLK